MEKLSYLQSLNNMTGEYTTFPDLWEAQVFKEPNKEAFVFFKHHERSSITSIELYERCLTFAAALTKLGIKKGDVVVIELGNCIQWLVIEFSLILIGAVPINAFALRDDASDHRYIVKRSNPVAFFTTDVNHKALHTLQEMVASDEYPSLKHVIVVDLGVEIIGWNFGTKDDNSDDTTTCTPNSTLDTYTADVLSFSKLLFSEKSRFDRRSVYIDPDDLALIMRSSGTTGTPKLVPHSHRTFIRALLYYKDHVDINGDVKFITNCNFGWILGTPLYEIVTGWTKVSTFGGLATTPEFLLECAEKEKCQIVLFTSDILHQIMDHLGGKLPSCVQYAYCGGSPIKQKVGCLTKNIKALINLYGQMENGVVTSEKIDKNVILEDRMAGYPVPGVELKVTDDDLQLVERGTYGNIYVRTNYRFHGYYNDEDSTKEVLGPDGWFASHDVGYISREGKLFVVGRRQDEIMRGVKRIHSSEIELLIKDMEIAGLRDVMAVPVPDKTYGQEICVCIIKDSESSLEENDLRNIFDEKIASIMHNPRYIIFVKTYPVNTNGKVLRHELIKHAVKTLGIME